LLTLNGPEQTANTVGMGTSGQVTSLNPNALLRRACRQNNAS